MPEPSIIGKCKIEGRLGQGGMGAAYLARDSRIGRLVAVKVLRVDNEEMRNRFELEAQSAGRLKQPNIVTIHDYEEYDGTVRLNLVQNGVAVSGDYVDGQGSGGTGGTDIYTIVCSGDLRTITAASRTGTTRTLVRQQ